MKQTRINIGVLGATGFIGVPYRKELLECENVSIVGLCARRTQQLEDAVKLDNARFGTKDWREIIHHPGINYVLVCTPDALHKEAILECAQAGKHVFCEKPVGMDAKESFEMMDVFLKRNDLAHFVPFWTRWSPGFVKSKSIIDSGILGEIKSIVYRWHNPRPEDMSFTWRDDSSLSSGGSIADVGSHAYDTIRFLTGLEATEVLTHAETITPSKLDRGNINLSEALDVPSHSSDFDRRRGDTPDYANISFKLTNGATGILVVSHAHYLRKGIVPELEVHGEKASIIIDRYHGKVSLFHGIEDKGEVFNVESGGFDIGNRFKKIVIPALLQVINGKQQTELEVPNLKDGWKVQLFTDAALKSHKLGQWVSIKQ